jgi:uncharacterized protein YjbI with pentapeptide repeats
MERIAAFVTLKPDELDRILVDHISFLNNARGGKRAILSSLQLGRMDLSNCQLAKAEICGAILTGATLKFANFSQATLYCSEMCNVDGRFANFSQADMRGVTLNGSNLSHARLDGADFRSGRLMKSGSSGVPEAVIDRNGSATGVDFSYCSLNGATFEGADLKDANFTGAVIVGTKFKGARMAGVKLNGAILTDVDLSEMHLPPDAFTGCVLPPTRQAIDAKQQVLFRLTAHNSWVESDARRGACAVLDGMDLRPVATVIGKYKLTAISARQAIAAGVDFSCTELQGANFEGADLRGANFEGADLRGVRFQGALVHHARFLGADMRPLQLKSGEILPCDLTDTAFGEQQRADAVFA